MQNQFISNILGPFQNEIFWFFNSFSPKNKIFSKTLVDSGLNKWVILVLIFGKKESSIFISMIFFLFQSNQFLMRFRNDSGPVPITDMHPLRSGHLDIKDAQYAEKKIMGAKFHIIAYRV